MLVHKLCVHSSIIKIYKLNIKNESSIQKYKIRKYRGLL